MVGEKIKQLIENQGTLPKSEVAKKIGISDTGLYNLFTRDSVETKYLESLAKIYEVPLSYFFDEDLMKKPASRESVKFGNEVMDILKDQLREMRDQMRQKDTIIMELIQRVGKDEVLASAGLGEHFLYLAHTNLLTPSGLLPLTA